MNWVATSTRLFLLGRLRVEGQRGVEIARAVLSAALPVVVWGVTAILLGFVVGFAAVILPPTGAFGIVAAIGLVLLWVTPDLPRPPTRALPLVFAIVLFCMMCVPNYYALDVPGLPWISIRRLALLVMILPLAIVVAGSSRYRAEIRQKLANEKAISICLIGFLICSALSIPVSSNFPQSLSFVIDDALSYYIPFFVGLYLLTSVRKIERLMEAICWYSLLVGMLGVLEFHLKRRFYFDIMPKWYLNALMEANPSVYLMVTTSSFRNGFYRASSIFTIPIAFGEFAMMVAPFGWYFLVHGRGARRRLLALAMIITSLLGIFVSGSRGAYMGLFVALAAFVTLWIIRNARQDRNSLLTPFAILVASVSAVVLVTAIMLPGRLHGTVFGNSALDAASADARWQQWDLLKPKLWESPLLGHGRGLSGGTIGYFSPGATIPTVDSNILSLLADIGIPGTLFFYGIVLFSIGTAARQYIFDTAKDRALPQVALCCSVIGFGQYSITLSSAENWFFFFLNVSAIVALSAANAATDARPASAKSRQAGSTRPVEAR